MRVRRLGFWYRPGAVFAQAVKWTFNVGANRRLEAEGRKPSG